MFRGSGILEPTWFTDMQLHPPTVPQNGKTLLAGLDFQVRRSHWLVIALLLIVASAPAAVVPFPFAGLALEHDASARFACVNNLLQINFAAESFASDTGHLPANFQDLTNHLDSPKWLLCPANSAHLPPASWADFNWNEVDYELVPGANFANPSAPLCRCNIHNNSVNVDGSTTTQPGYRPGWPAVVVNPLYQFATADSTVQFEVKIVTNALQPLSFQWRRQHLYYVTNITFMIDTNAPGGGSYRTNFKANFTVTILPGETNSIYTIANANTNLSDYYSVATSNSMGVALSDYASLRVDPIAAIMATNDYWFAARCQVNLRQITLLGALWEDSYPAQPVTNLNQMVNIDGSSWLEWPVQLYCPADQARTAPTNWNDVDFSDTSYEIKPHPSRAEDPFAAFCECKVHHYVSALGGSVSYSTNSPLVLRLLVNQTTAYGGNAVFRASALGLPPLTYAWSKDGQPISNATNAALPLTNVLRADAGVYSVWVSNSVGSASSSAALTVQVPQRLSNPRFVPPGAFQLISSYADGWPVAPTELAGFEAQASSNLVNWVTLPNSLAVSGGSLILQDTSSAKQPSRFYRIVQP
jgi:hypothetical protein